ncbi:MAG: Uma2 family endonuclease, partial [Chloroflexota bacterium]|nr:Uma2 family endonuclease [Chloroflexota bacterium]
MVTTTAPPAPATPTAPAGVAPLRRLFTVAEYQQMGEIAIFHPDERTELIAGEIFSMAALGFRHGACVDELTEQIILQLGKVVRVRTQGSFYLDGGSQPEPDLLVLRRRDDGYGTSLPQPADVLLLIEVSDTTLVHDRKVKLPLYAAAGIAEVW